MHDQRFTNATGGADVGPKTLPLPFRLIFLPVVIQSGFTNAEDFRMLRKAA